MHIHVNIFSNFFSNENYINLLCKFNVKLFLYKNIHMNSR